MWTRFMDMYSGGSLKEKWQYIYIEAPQEEAELIFYNRFGHNPHRVSCTCCGSDYSIDDAESIEDATGYDRGCDYDSEKGKYVDRPSTSKFDSKFYVTLEQYKASPDRLFIYAEEILPKERIGILPEQGYVWQD